MPTWKLWKRLILVSYLKTKFCAHGWENWRRPLQHCARSSVNLETAKGGVGRDVEARMPLLIPRMIGMVNTMDDLST
jgi:hypothetical protein